MKSELTKSVMAILALLLAFTLSCSNNIEIPSSSGVNKSPCIRAGLEVKANTLNDVAVDCSVIRSEVLAQITDNVGYCNKNDLDFNKSIRDITSECGVTEIPLIDNVYPSRASSSSVNNSGSMPDVDVASSSSRDNFSSSSLSDSDDDEPEEPGPSPKTKWEQSDITGSGWTRIGTVVLGDRNSSIGSFLDIDNNRVITLMNATANKNEIDIIYDGTNLWTPYGCGSASSNCVYKSYLTDADPLAFLYDLTDLPYAVPSLSAENFYYAAYTGQTVNALVVTYYPKGIFYVQTSDENYALILVSARAENTIELIVAYEYYSD